MSWLTDKIAELQEFLASNDESNNKVTQDLNTLKVIELKAIAKERGLKGYTSLRKSELIDLLK